LFHGLNYTIWENPRLYKIKQNSKKIPNTNSKVTMDAELYAL